VLGRADQAREFGLLAVAARPGAAEWHIHSVAWQGKLKDGAARRVRARP
jgi:hypothetical protein